MQKAEPPICWLASYPKSGNTWLRMWLAAFISDRPIDINHLPLRFAFSDSQPYTYSAVSPVPLDRLPPEHILHLRNAVLMHFIAMASSPNVFVKTHCANVEMSHLRLIPPTLTAGAIYVVRDPRDVALSWARHLGVEPKEAVDLMCNEGAIVGGGKKFGYGENIITGLRSWGQHVMSWTADTPWPGLMVRYEDMVENPMRVFRNVTKFLKMPLDNERIRRAIKRTSFDNLAKQERESGFTEAVGSTRFFYKGKVGVWKDELDPLSQARLTGKFGDLMQKLHYGPDGVQPLPAAA